jgi:hypothetical protein
MSKKNKSYSPHEYDWGADIKYSDKELVVIRNGVYEILDKNDLRKLKIEEILKGEDDV